jgi:hypothetical protein
VDDSRNQVYTARENNVQKNIASHVLPTKLIKSVKHSSRSFINLSPESRDNLISRGSEIDRSSAIKRPSLISNDSIATSRRHEQMFKKEENSEFLINEIKVIGTKKNSKKVYDYINKKHSNLSK